MAYRARVRVGTSTTGTGTVSLGAAVIGYRTFAAGGVADGESVSYAIEDSNGGFEFGHGTYTASGTTLARTTIEGSSNAGSAISLSGTAQVFLDVLPSDFAQLAALSGAQFIGIKNIGQTEFSWPAAGSDSKYRVVGLRYDGTSISLVSTAGDTSLAAAQASTSLGAGRPFSWNPATGAVSLVADGSAILVGGPLQVNAAAAFGSTMSVTGALSTNGSVAINSAGGLLLTNTQVGADAKTSRVYESTGSLVFDMLNDAQSSSNPWLLVNRSGAAPTGVFHYTSLYPVSDNALDLGGSSNRLRNIYSYNNPTVGSDARLKGPPLDFDDAFLDAWANVRWRLFQRLKALADEGPSKARWHSGVIAQELIATLAAAGVDATRYGLLCHDEWEALPRIEQAFVPGIPDRLSDAGEVLSWSLEPIPACVIQEGRNAGDSYSVRYEQALVAEAAWGRREHERAQAALADLAARVAKLEQSAA